MWRGEHTAGANGARARRGAVVAAEAPGQRRARGQRPDPGGPGRPPAGGGRADVSSLPPPAPSIRRQRCGREAAPSFSTEVAASLVALETEIIIGSQLMATPLTRVGATTIRQADLHTVLLKLMHRKRESGSVAPLFWEVVTRAEHGTRGRPPL